MAAADKTTLITIPSYDDRLKAQALVDQKLVAIRETFKEIEVLADANRLYVVWDGMDNYKGGWGSNLDRVIYQGDGEWRSSGHEDC